MDEDDTLPGKDKNKLQKQTSVPEKFPFSKGNFAEDRLTAWSIKTPTCVNLWRCDGFSASKSYWKKVLFKIIIIIIINT